MRTITTCIIISVLLTSSALAQSNSFLKFKEKFSNADGVHCFSTNGFLAKTVLWMAGEHEYHKAIKEIQNVSLITAPKSAFRAEGVTVAGFKKVLRDDSFEELAHVRDNGDDVTIYLKTTQSKSSRYMILVEDSDNVVAIEIRGYIDPKFFINNTSLCFNQ